MQKIRVKVCCICSVEEAKLATAYGASALGLVGHMPSGPGVISNRRIYKITNSAPPMVSTFLLTSKTKSSAIIDHYKKSAFLSHLSISMAGIHKWKGVLGSQILGYDGHNG